MTNKITDFKPQKQNANKHTSYGLRLLEESVQKDGWVDGQTAAADGEIISGSARLELAADKFADVEPIIVDSDGTRPVIIRRTDIPNANSPRARRLSVAANKIAQVDFDPDWALLKEWGGEDEQIKKLFSDDEWREGTGEEAPQVDAEPQIDRAAELQTKWATATGQLWKLGEHRLLIGDCTVQENVEKLMGGERAQGCFTSPPYADRREYDESTGFKPISPDIYVEWWKGVQSAVSETLLENGSFFVNIKPHCDDGQRVLYVFDLVLSMVRNWGWMLIDELCWIRQSMPNGTSYRFRNGFEPVYHFSKNTPFGNFSEMRQVASEMTKPKRYRKSGSGSGLHNFDYSPDEGALPDNVIFVNTGEVNIGTTSHPATFPVRLPEFFIAGFSVNNDIWFEPFAGSGTTIIAAHNLNRRCYAMEISPAYGGVILERFFTATGIQPELVE